MEGDHHESEQGTLGERRLHPHRRDHARERRGARRHVGDHRGARRPRPRLWRRHDSPARGTARGERPWRRHRQQSRRCGQRPSAEPRVDQLPVPGRRCVRPERARRRQLRPRRQHLRRDVRPAAVRRGEGGRSRDPARRPDRDGELDPQRPDARRPDPEDQLRLLTAASGRIRQPDDLGSRGQRRRAFRSGGRASREHLVRARHLHVPLPRLAVGVPGRASGSTTARR